jgi:hypothetical protein
MDGQSLGLMMVVVLVGVHGFKRLWWVCGFVDVCGGEGVFEMVVVVLVAYNYVCVVWGGYCRCGCSRSEKDE